MFHKFGKLRSGSRAHAPVESDNERPTWPPQSGTKKYTIRSILRGEDPGYATESFFRATTMRPVAAKKLHRSKHTIDTTLTPASQNLARAPRTPVSVASRKSVEFIREHTQLKSWTAEVEKAGYDNGDSRRKSCEPVLSSQPRYSDNRRGDHSDRSWTCESSSSTTDDDEHLGRSMSDRSEAEGSADEDSEYADAEEKFLQANTAFFETLALENIRRDQYPKLALHRHVYMDYASLALSSRFQMEEHMRLVMAGGHMFGTKSTSVTEYAAMAQSRLLKMLHTSRSVYTTVFTTGLKASYRLVANAYPFQKNSPILLCQDNHDVVNQLITAAVKAGGKPVMAPLEESDLSISRATIRPLMKRHMFQPGGSLFVYPAQSSLTGIRHSMHWIAKAHKSDWHVLLDASTLLPSGNLDLSQYQPDFVLGSFQNIVGYPSGMGFLLVRRASFTVSSHANAISLTPKPSPSNAKDVHIVAEDESLSKLSFAGLDFGLQHLQSVGLDDIATRVSALATWMVHKLKGLRHIDPPDWSLANVYSPYMAENRGNIISFNVLDSTGEVVLPTLVQRLAAKNQITLAVGSFNNPGVANLLGSVKERVKSVGVFERTPKFHCVQVSLGPMSNFEDAYRVVQFITKFRNQDYVSMAALGFMEEAQLSALSQLDDDR